MLNFFLLRLHHKFVYELFRTKNLHEKNSEEKLSFFLEPPEKKTPGTKRFPKEDPSAALRAAGNAIEHEVDAICAMDQHVRRGTNLIVHIFSAINIFEIKKRRV